MMIVIDNNRTLFHVRQFDAGSEVAPFFFFGRMPSEGLAHSPMTRTSQTQVVSRGVGIWIGNGTRWLGSF